MLPFQVGAIDLATRARSRPGVGNMMSWKRAVRASAAGAFWPRRVSRPWLYWVMSMLLPILFAADIAVAAKPKGKKQKALAPSPSASAGEQSLTNIPLPIGHEAKGLVLPDFDSDGHLRGRFEAARARRLDEEHVGFESLKIITYTPENQVDLTIELPESVLDLKTRILSSNQRSTVTRADFNIVGDSVQFDTNSRTGKMIGNVKMVITDRSHFVEKSKE
jgi:hypothetical protein